MDDILAIPFITNRLRHWQARLHTAQRLESQAREALQALSLHLATQAASGESITLASKEVQQHARLVMRYERRIQQCQQRLAHYTERLAIEMAAG